MSKLTKITVSVAITLLLLGAFFAVSAAAPQQPGPSRDISGLHFPPPVNEVNKANFVTTATGTFSLAAGFTIEDSVKFYCGSVGSSTCTLVVNSFATSSGAGQITEDDRALCLVVDNNIVGACAYLGYEAVDGSYSAVNAINNTVVNSGNHSAFMLFYSTYGTTLYTFTNVYNVYKP